MAPREEQLIAHIDYFTIASDTLKEDDIVMKIYGRNSYKGGCIYRPKPLFQRAG